MPPTRNRQLWLVGATVRVVREARGIPGTEFARDVGISAGHLSSIERQRRQVSDAVLVKLARRLGVTVDDITVNLEELAEMQQAVLEAATP